MERDGVLNATDGFVYHVHKLFPQPVHETWIYGTVKNSSNNRTSSCVSLPLRGMSQNTVQKALSSEH